MLHWLPKIQFIDISTAAILIVSLAYFGCLCFLLMQALALHNVIQFLIRQSRWKVLPLLFFYLMAVIALSTRVYTLVWIVDDFVCGRIFNFYFPMVCKLIVGYTQVWTICELTVRLK